jgi:F0F1-type ATP synthase membrane subunit b/b'
MVSLYSDDNIKLVMLLFCLVLLLIFVFIFRTMRSMLYERELHYKEVPAFLFIWSVML